MEIGSGQNLADFQEGFLDYWHERMTDEQFVSFFIAPNLTWKHSYEDMVEKRRLGNDRQAQLLIYEIEQRIKYEIMLEFGLNGKIGRTLEKSNCSVISFAVEDVIRIANTKSLINDENDDRNNVFYCKQLLVDVDEDHDIAIAYRMDNEDFKFGYEFVRKATLREINFGESDITGEKLFVSGVEEVRKGFKICKYCGKIQSENGKANHSFACKTRKMPVLMQSDAYEECLFLYREFNTEILRLLVPATTMDSSSVKMESFVAAFMLGMKEYFGNVDHLRASIIVDEGQDFSDNAYRLIRALAGEEHPNDIFIVGDSHQRIYRNHPTLSKCGINVRGRSSILKINYRTTEEIRKHAFALLKGISFDDLDNEFDLGDQCQSLTHGEKPIVKNFSNANEEFEFLLSEVKRLRDSSVALTDICVVARTKKLVDDYIALFTKAGIRSYAIKRNKVDDRSLDGLRIATMHRVKGLEFKYVFVAAANTRILPLMSAIDKTDAVSESESMTSEKCLLYVAMTRAQKGVYITSYGRPSEFLEEYN